MKVTSVLLVAASILSVVVAFSPLRVQSKKNFSPTGLLLAVGETAPDFSLKDQNGKIVKRSSFKKPLVVYFYPADATPGCTVQAQTFNQEINEIRQKFGADVVGISGQDVASKQRFAKDLGLTYSILADEGDSVRNGFKVPKAAFGLLPGRVTYVLDKDGKCISVYDNLGDAKSHIDQAKKVLATMTK